MSKRNIKFPTPASPKQLAQIHSLTDRQHQLELKSILPPFSLLAMAIPFLLSRYCLNPGGYLNQLHLWIVQKIIEKPELATTALSTHFKTAPSAHFMKLGLPLAGFKDKIQEKIYFILREFDSVFFSPKISGFIARGYDVSNMDYFEFLEFRIKTLELLEGSPDQLLKLVSDTTLDTIRDRFVRKAELLDILISVNNACYSSPLKNESFITQCLHSLKIENSKVIKPPSITINTQLFRQYMNMPIQKTIGWIRLVYDQLIQEFNHSDELLITFGAISFYDIVVGSPYIESQVLLITIIAGALAKTWLINPLIQSIHGNSHKFLQKYLVKPPVFLSSEEANKRIKLLEKRNNQLASYAKASSLAFDLALPLLCISTFLYFYIFQNNMPIELSIPILGFMGSMLPHLYNFFKVTCEKHTTNQKFSKIANQFDKMLSAINCDCFLEKKDQLSTSYFIIQSIKVPRLSLVTPGNILDAITLSFSSHGINILEKSHNILIVEPKELSDRQVTKIYQQINNYLEQLEWIKSVKKKINKALKTEAIEVRRLNKSTGVLEVEFLVNEQIFIPNNIKNLCQIEKQNGYSSIIPDENFASEFTELKFSASPQLDIKPANKSDEKPELDRKSELPEASDFQRKNLKNKLGNLDAWSSISAKKANIIKWPGGYAYDSSQKDCPIKLFFRNYHFVVFAIPPEYFPTQVMYEEIKKQVEKARFAHGPQDAQGIQFRPTQARNYKGEVFNSEARVKLEGSTYGNIRLFGRPVYHKLGVLHIIEGVDFNAHKNKSHTYRN